MINNKRILGLITARGGSKGVKKKNIRMVAGKPLIAWTIEEAKKSRYIDRLILSSDDDEIIIVAQSFDCEVPFVRPSELAQDHTSGMAPVLHAIEEISGFDYVLLLQPTSPLRSVADIDSCIEHCVQGDHISCVSVTETDKSPYWMYQINEDKRLTPIITTDRQFERRQELPSTYVLNGAIYIAKVDWLKEHKSFMSLDTVAFKMPKARSYDIDTELDLAVVEMLMSKYNELV